ncbi:hypothetical protein ACDQ55_19785 [Chitinophaga sp. 30R24]|uniref:hypothetical protein n=1 Tax=Chitinophaga sp. 30R24 TaxID=3248838 RepID=UPI003B9074B0
MKKIILLTFACISCFSAYSQRFMHGVGIIIFADNVTSSNTSTIGGLTYSTRFNFLEKDNMSISVGVPLNIGLGGRFSGDYNSSSDNSESNNLRFMFNLPVVFNLNFGRGSTRSAHNRFGFFAGAGYGYYYGSRNENYKDSQLREYNTSYKYNTTGPVANAGFRIGVGKTHNLEVKLSYMKGLNNNMPNIFSSGVIFNF